MSRIENYNHLKPPELWQEWLKLHNNETQAIANAVWVANRLVKDLGGGDEAWEVKRAFYSIKDHFLKLHQDDLIKGCIARVEKMWCFLCEGTGLSFDDGPPCILCNGRSAAPTPEHILYLHELLIERQRYSFYSYIKPHRLSDQPGQHLPVHRRRYTQDEKRRLPLPFQGLLRLLEYTAIERWGLDLFVGQYVPSAEAQAKRAEAKARYDEELRRPNAASRRRVAEPEAAKPDGAD